MAITPDTEIREDIRQDTSETGGGHAGPHQRRRLPIPDSTLSWASVVVAAAAMVALATFAFTGRDDPATQGPVRAPGDPSTEASVPSLRAEGTGGADTELTTPAEYPPNYYPHGYDYGDARLTQDDASADEFVPGSHNVPMR
jgi:hypothetical protein